MVICTLTVILILVWLKKYADESTRKKFRYILALILIIQDVLLTVWYATSGAWDWKLTLPLELSRISIMLTAIMLFTKNHTIFEFLFLLSLGGFTQAIVTPNVTYTLPHFRYIAYFLSHYGMMLAAFYMLVVEGYKPTLKSIFKTIVILNILVVIVGSINHLLPAIGLTDIPGNYMFLARRPDVPTIIDLLIEIFGPHPWYILGFELLAVVSFTAVYLPFSIYYMIKRSPKPKGDAIFLNIVPGFGLGSLLQKNYYAGITQLVLQLIGLSIYGILSNIYPDEYFRNMVVLLMILSAGYIFGIISSLVYDSDKEQTEVDNLELNNI